MMLASSDAAVIEVTAGGDVSDPTYQLSDAQGHNLANLTATSVKVKASVDVEKGSGNSLDDLATRLAAAEATIAALTAVTVFPSSAGTGWTLMRRVVGGYCHPSTDNLAGTDSYGSLSTSHLSPNTFTRTWTDSECGQFLFATGVWLTDYA
eukprot:398993-Prymnesium_polylepis.1